MGRRERKTHLAPKHARQHGVFIVPRAQRAHEAPILHAQLDVDVVIFIVLRDGRLQLADALLEFCALGDDTMPGRDGLLDLRVLAFEAGTSGKGGIEFGSQRRDEFGLSPPRLVNVSAISLACCNPTHLFQPRPERKEITFVVFAVGDCLSSCRDTTSKKRCCLAGGTRKYYPIRMPSSVSDNLINLENFENTHYWTVNYSQRASRSRKRKRPLASTRQAPLVFRVDMIVPVA